MFQERGPQRRPIPYPTICTRYLGHTCGYWVFGTGPPRLGCCFFGQDPLPPGLWLPAEGEMLPGSSRFAVDAVVFISVFTRTSLRASSLRHSPPSAGSVERSGCLSSCWPQADPHDPRVITGIQCCGGPETTNDAARARGGGAKRVTRGGSLRPLDQHWLHTGA